jgi:haloalkane dehalogenase
MSQEQLPAEVLNLYSSDLQRVKVKSGVMAYLDHGPKDGRPVLLLHGNPSSSFLWRDLIVKLGRQGRRVIAPDHVGMGASERVPQFLRLADRIADIEALLDHLQIKEFDLGVHDWGGAIGLGVAGRRPQQVGKILLTNTGAFLSEEIPTRIALCRFPYLGRFLVEKFNAFAWPATWMAVEQPLPPAVKRGFLQEYQTSQRRQAIADFVADIPMELDHPTRPVLQEVADRLVAVKDKPMLICWGLKDFCFNHTFLDEFLRRFPNAQQLIFPKAGHYVLEDAKEAALEPIAAFFGPA